MEEELEFILNEFGLEPDERHLSSIRRLIIEEINNKDSRSTEYLKTLCIQLFSIGKVEDTSLVWSAKKRDFDAGCYIDVQLLCGAGLEITKEYLKHQNTREAVDEYKYIIKCEEAEDFSEFSRESIIEFYRDYYKPVEIQKGKKPFFKLLLRLFRRGR